jgi:hypothetical protein
MIKERPLTVAIRGSGGGGEVKSKGPVEAPNSLKSTAYARVVDLISEGPIVGLVNGLKSIFYNEVPLQNADGTFNFKDVQVDTRLGTQDQPYIPGFAGVENETGIGLELLYGAPFSYTISNTDVSAVRIRLSVGSLTKTDRKNGNIDGYSVAYAIDIQTDGGSFIEKFSSSFTGKTTSKYERSHRLDLPAAIDGWVIRVRRLTPQAADSSITDQTFVESITDIIDAKLRYPNSALVSTQIDAKQFQAIPARAFHMKGLYMKTPSNYNAATRVYTGIWDGTFIMQYTNNPAWVYFLFATNKRFGAGKMMKEEDVDKWELYKIGKYCDELVPDGFGGMEPRFTCNAYLQTRVDAYRLLQDLASVFRGMSYWQAGMIKAVADMPEDPVYQYNNSNVIEGKFRYGGSGKRARHTTAMVSWNDMSDFCRPKPEYVEDDDGIARYGINELNATGFGCTSRGQAHRTGKWMLVTERIETDIVEFAVGLDGTVAAPGQIVRIADTLRAGKRIGGRVAGFNAVSKYVKVDKLDPSVEIGHTLTVITASGVAETQTISSVDFVNNRLYVGTYFSQSPTVDAAWITEAPELVAQRFRILSVVEDVSETQIIYKITALQHREDKFDYVELGTPLEEPPITSRPNTVVAAPTELTITAFVRNADGIGTVVVAADWKAGPEAVAYDVLWRKDEGEWVHVRHPSSHFEIPNAFYGEYTFMVSAINVAARASEPTVARELIDDEDLGAVDLIIDSGVVVVDCKFTAFHLDLDENVTSVQFINVSQSDVIIITVEQIGGGHTLDFGPSVTPITGVPYVASTPAGAVDVLGLTTIDKGLTWRMTAQQPVVDTGGGTAALTVAIAPSPATGTVAYSGTPVAPTRTVTATPAGGTAPYTYSWTRADSGGTAFTPSSSTAAGPTFTIPTGSTAYNVTQSWRCTVHDSAGAVAQALVSITLKRTVSASGAIALSNHATIWGKSNAALADSHAEFALKASGAFYWYQTRTISPGYLEGTYAGEWLVSGTATAYEARVTKTSGAALSGGTVGSWVPLGTTDKYWSQEASTPGDVVTTVLLVEIRDTATLTIQDSCTVTLTASVSESGGGGMA